ncbi:MAG: hypothetical protein GX198_02925 [Epulopiscium sp.]|nr:hypothetical protein [Candidatus Epulonipiscium sp.]HOQ16069.1 hypothetical protein [Defluviitaleaceae bacterium]HPT76446.1 hypothetical protein [Defluviitaleaceae bacterium]
MAQGLYDKDNDIEDFDIENERNVSIDKYLPGNLYEPYERGDILLSFCLYTSVEKAGEICTIWGEIQPILEENCKEGVCFQKIKYKYQINIVSYGQKRIILRKKRCQNEYYLLKMTCNQDYLYYKINPVAIIWNILPDLFF